jgi:hypothetical protein
MGGLCLSPWLQADCIAATAHASGALLPSKVAPHFYLLAILLAILLTMVAPRAFLYAIKYYTDTIALDNQ